MTYPIKVRKVTREAECDQFQYSDVEIVWITGNFNQDDPSELAEKVVKDVLPEIISQAMPLSTAMVDVEIDTGTHLIYVTILTGGMSIRDYLQLARGGILNNVTDKNHEYTLYLNVDIPGKQTTMAVYSR